MLFRSLELASKDPDLKKKKKIPTGEGETAIRRIVMDGTEEVRARAKLSGSRVLRRTVPACPGLKHWKRRAIHPSPRKLTWGLPGEMDGWM